MRVGLKVLALAALLVVQGAALAAEGGAGEKTAATGQPLFGGPEDFHFVVFSDRVGGERPGIFPKAIEHANLLMPDFVICVGDLIEGYTEDPAELDAMYKDLDGLLANLRMPFYRVAGNHDVSNEMMAKEWRNRFGAPYYSFTHRGVLFLCLNSQDGPATAEYNAGFGAEQTAFIEKTLAENQAVRWTFVFMHQPLWVKPDYKDTGWDKVQEMLASRPHTVFAGHWHEYAKHNVGGHDYIRLSTTGGASEVRGTDMGEFDHITWVTVTRAEPVVANVAIGGLYADDVATEETSLVHGDMPSAVSAPSIVTEQDTLTELSIPFVLTNRTNVPKKVRAAFGKAEGLTVTPDTIEKTLPPGAKETVEVKIAAASPMALAALPALQVDWSAEYALSGKPPLTASGKARVAVEGLHKVARASRPVVVDGKLDEWGAMEYRCDAPAEVENGPLVYNGPEDAHFAFSAPADDEYLYIAVEAADDKLLWDPTRQVRGNDALTVLVDPRPRSERAAGGTDWTKFVAVIVSPGTSDRTMQLADAQNLPEGVQVVSIATPAGHSTEIAIPVKALDAIQRKPWEDVRINVRLHDLDDPLEPCPQLYWRPKWDGLLNYTDSGTFRRQ